jgi:hypothetical protein
MAVTLKIVEMTIDGHPYGCPDCASPTFALDGRGILDAFPAWGNCPSSHSWEDPLITIGVLKEIRGASTGRERAEDDDTFEIDVHGARLAGILYPELIVDDIKRAARDVYWKRLIKPAIRKQKNRAVRSVKRGVSRAVKRPVSNTVAAAKAAAIGAAWGIQAGGHEPDPDYQPEPINPCPACDEGWIKIESRVHGKTTVRCSVCLGTGEID